MSSLAAEITQQLRNNIKHKLTNIGVYVDNELPDYIMVMVANQKSRYQMKDDLSLFLGKNTDEFVDWLHETLKNVQSQVAAATESQSDSDKKKSNTSSKGLADVEKATNDRWKKKRRNSETDGKQMPGASVKETHDSRRRQSLQVPTENLPATTDQMANSLDVVPNQNQEQEVVLQLNADNGETDELLQETMECNESPPTKEQEKTSEKRNGTLGKKVSRLPSSTVGAVVTHEAKFKDEDEETYDPAQAKSLPSVIKVSERKSSVPPERQANKMLILRAVQEAHKSVSNTFLKRKLLEEAYTPTPIVKKLKQNASEQQDHDLDPDDLRHLIEANRQQEVEPYNPSQVAPNLRADKRTEIMDNVQKEEQITPKFIVTLDGIKNHFALKMGNSDGIDELMLDEEIDEEFVEMEDQFIQAKTEIASEETHSANKKLIEKCKYYPSCKNGDNCQFYHPSVPCKAFPNCRFGSNCLYIHPHCKYDLLCAKPECPFTHSINKLQVPTFKSTSVPLVMTPCKYYPNCANPVCPFFHPKPCAYGSKCRNPHCSFSHPPLSYSASLPKPHQLKWKAQENISEPKFQLEEAVEMPDMGPDSGLL